MSRSLALVALFGVGFISIGCGGGSGGGSGSPTGMAPSGPSQTETVGNASLTYQGKLRAAVTATSQSVTAVGVAGATISALSYYPTNNIADTNVVFADSGDIYSYSERTGIVADISHNSSTSSWPSCSNNGFVAFTRINQLVPTQSDIWYARTDGSSQTKVSSGAYYVSASIAPNASATAAVDYDGNLWRVTSAGVPTKLISTATMIVQPYEGIAWSPDSSRIAFCAYGNIYTIPSTGGTPTQISPTMGLIFPTWSADSSQIVASALGSIYTLSSTGSSGQTPKFVVGSAALGDAGPAFSPDGKKIAYFQTGSGVQDGIFTCDPNGKSVSYLAPFQSTYTSGSMSWSSFLTQQNMIGSGGILTSSASSGFVVANGLTGFGSLLSFSATTPSTATVSSTNSNDGPIAFTVSANSLTSVSWINSYYGPSITKTLTNTTQLVFGVDGTTGAVSFVAPALGAKSTAVSRVAKGSSTIYGGRFVCVFDAQGNNLAPAGATSITVDGKTNCVLSTR